MSLAKHTPALHLYALSTSSRNAVWDITKICLHVPAAKHLHFAYRIFESEFDRDLC